MRVDKRTKGLSGNWCCDHRRDEIDCHLLFGHDVPAAEANTILDERICNEDVNASFTHLARIRSLM